jgi:iron-sulfur cluster assembly protein
MKFGLTTKEINVSTAAQEYLRGLIGAGAPSGGVRLSIKSGKGCGGAEYDLSRADGPATDDETLQVDAGLAIYIPVHDTLKLFGTTIDYVTDAVGNRHLQITNPNEKGRCGCGESVVL